jgi:hypothetical protein
MKILSILLIISVIFACNDRTKNIAKSKKTIILENLQQDFVVIENDTIKLNNFSIKEINQREYSKITPVNNLFKFDSRYSKINSENHITSIYLDNGKTLNFKDTLPYSEETVDDKNDVTESIMYELVGFNKSFNCFSFKKYLYEDVDFFIIDKSNGKKIKTWNRPILNKKGNLMFCEQNPLFLMWEDVSSGFQIFERNKNKISKIEEIKLKNLMTFDGKWYENDELYLKLLSREKYMKNQRKTKSGFKYVKISRKTN